VTLIEGGPGTGKTAVALHRAAHLLYRDRRRFEGGGVLLVGPSPVFMSYVERVLPSLGEDTVELRSLGELVDGVSAERLDPPALAAVKGSLRMRSILRRAVRDAPAGAPTELRVVFGGEVLRLREGELSAVRRSVSGRVQRPNLARTEARRALVDALWRVRPEGSLWNQKRFAEEVPDTARVRRVPAPVVADPYSDRGARRLADRRRLARAAGSDLSADEMSLLVASWRDVTADTLSVADVALVDELRVLLGEPPQQTAKRDPYLLIDGVRELTLDRRAALRAARAGTPARQL
jgi:hypothetical protein